MKYCSFPEVNNSPPLPVVWSEAELKVLACSVLHVHESKVSVFESLQMVSYQLEPGRFAYLRFDGDNGELELFLPRDYCCNPKRIL